MATARPITPCLWFDRNAEEAVRFYTAIFPNSRIVYTSHYGVAGREIHGMEPGTVLTIVFELNGQQFTALNGGPHVRFNEAISFEIRCSDEAELDHYWDRLSEGGDPTAQQCGWLKDQYGVSWQVIPASMDAMLQDPDMERRDRVMAALLPMKKLDVPALERAWRGDSPAAAHAGG